MNKPLFEYTHSFTPEEYKSIYKQKITSGKNPLTFKKIIKRTLGLIITALSFLSIYTAAIGIFLLSIFLITLFESKLQVLISNSLFNNKKYLKYKLKYSIDENGFKVVGNKLNVRVSWDLIYKWQTREDWLIITSYVIPVVFFPISKLVEAGAYDRILEIVKEKGEKITYLIN